MYAVIIGVVAAVILRIFAHVAFGDEGMLTNAWVDVVFWTLIAGGVAVALINVCWACIPCLFAKWSGRKDLNERFCHRPPCS